MYQNFFQLTQNAFSAAPDPALLYVTPTIQRTLQALEQTLAQGIGIGMLTAPAGLGKTLICKTLKSLFAGRCTLCAGSEEVIADVSGHLDAISDADGPFPVLLLQSQFPTRSSLLQAILFELNRPYARMSEQELRLELISYGRELAHKHQGIAIIVDEAHLLGEHILEELRGLTNYMYCTSPVFRVVLAGQLALEETLTNRSLEAVNQRLCCHVTLETLTRQESLEYIKTRIERSGVSIDDVFSAEALSLIVQASDGVPRCLNQLCDHTCLLASLAGTKPADETHVREALDDLMKLPLHWNISQARLDPVAELSRTTDSCGDCEDTQHDYSEKSNEETVEAEHQADEASVADLPNQTPTSEATQAASVFEIGGPDFSDSAISSTSQLNVDDDKNDLDFDKVEEGFDEVAFEQSYEAVPADIEHGGHLELGTSPDIVDELDEPARENASTIEFATETEEQIDEVELQVTASPLEESAESECKVIEVDSITPAERQNLAESLLADIEAPPASESQPCEEEVQDHYARLDARRLGQLSEVTSLESNSAESDLPQDQEAELEQSVEQSVLELTTELAAAIGETDGDIVPNPEDIIITASESFPEEDIEYDIVEPE